MIELHAAPRQRRMSLVTAIFGNVIPIVILGQHHRHTEHRQLLVVLIGTTVGIASPIVVNLLPARFQWSLRVASFSGIIGLTLLQANPGVRGGIDSPYAILLVMPMVWFGLMTTGRDLKAACVLVVACCFVPALVFPAYYGEPAQVMGPALALAVVSVSVALSLAGLTRETKVLTLDLRAAALRDLLTGLLNRRGWEDVTQSTLRDRSSRALVCVALLDLDNLKGVNDSMGHDVGDALLRGTGERLRDQFGQAAAVARLGGDEFAVLVIGDKATTVTADLEALLAVTPESARFSAGVALAAVEEDLRDTMRRADLALYEVKTTGRGRVLLADSAISLDGTGAWAERRPR